MTNKEPSLQPVLPEDQEECQQTSVSMMCFLVMLHETTGVDVDLKDRMDAHHKQLCVLSKLRLFKDLFTLSMPSFLAGINLYNNCVCLLFLLQITQELLKRLDVGSYYCNSPFDKIFMNRDHSQWLYTYWQKKNQVESIFFLGTLRCSILYTLPIKLQLGERSKRKQTEAATDLMGKKNKIQQMLQSLAFQQKRMLVTSLTTYICFPGHTW